MEVVRDAMVGGVQKFLTFRLGKEEYGLAILKVQEIIRMMKITRVPRAPAFVRGAINLRGKVIPVVDLRVKFGMPEREEGSRACIIVVQLDVEGEALTAGIIVNEVSEVTSLRAEQIEPPPSLGTSVPTDFIIGLGKVQERVLILLDIDKAMSSTDASIVEQAQAAASTAEQPS